MTILSVLITGVGGMVGSHMADYLYGKNIKVIGSYYNPTINLAELPEISIEECDVRYYSAVYNLIKKNMPSKIFHLAAQSYPTVSLRRPSETMDINIHGTINVFEAVKQIRNEISDYNPTVVVACSSAEYGMSLSHQTTPIKETAPLMPLHPYGVSKVAQDLLTYQYHVSDGLNGIRARIFNTTGTRKVNDVCADFTKRAVEIERGEKTVLRVGNLRTKRAITDVRDLVVALDLLADKGQPGEVYNISGKQVCEISDLILHIKNYMQIDFNIEVSEELLRPTDEPVIYGDSSKLETCTGWKQQYTIEQTIANMIEYWRVKT